MRSIIACLTILSLSVTALLCGCSESGHSYDRLIRLDQTLASFDDLDLNRKEQVVDSLWPEIDAMFSVLGIAPVDISTLESWAKSPVVRVFQPDVDSVFSNSNYINEQVGHILAKAESDSLELPDLMFATVTWGNPRPMVRVDSIVLIALNHYLGSDYPGYEQWQEYRRQEKTPKQLPYDLAAVLAATQYPMHCQHTPTLLNWMLYEGALVETRMRLVKDADLASALGYTRDQLDYVNANCRKIWEEMAVRRLIYETDPTIIDRYIAASPVTPLLNNSTPGRVGRYIGYMIVKSYLEGHREIKIRFLLSPQFYGEQRSLIESGFNPR